MNAMMRGAPSAQVTMSSLELVEFINTLRGLNKVQLRHDHFMAKVPKVLGFHAPKFLGTQKYGKGNIREICIFPKREACLMAMSYSYELQAIVYDRMTAQEGLARMGHCSSGPKVTGEIAIMESYFRLLRPASSSRLAMLTTIAKQNGLDATFLPSYVVDAPRAASSGSSLRTASLTHLLKANGISAKVPAYNMLLRDAGLLEACERESKSKGAKSGIKRFWCVTDLGLEYGKNLTSPSSPRETQPHWYVDRFAELHRIVSTRVLGV